MEYVKFKQGCFDLDFIFSIWSSRPGDGLDICTALMSHGSEFSVEHQNNS